MVKQFLITRPNYDKATAYIHSFSKDIVAAAKEDAGIHITDLEGTKAGYHSTRLGSKAAWETIKLAWRHREDIARVTVSAATAGAGVIKGTGEFIYDTGCIFYYSKEELAELETKIKTQSEMYSEIVNKNHHVWDAGIIAGTTLADYLTYKAEVPEDVNQAFQLAYPNLAEKHSFTEAVEDLDHAQLQGFLAGVKGKLFEIKYAGHLNNGHLPEGFTAELASSPNQPGWDIAILGPDKEIADVLQLKAADSVDYITAAIRKYPDIDVITTDEVHSQLVMHAAAEHVTNSGISDASLEHAVQSTADLDYDVFDFRLPLASLALIAFTEYIDSDKNHYQKCYSFGDRASKSFIAYTAGGVIAGLTQTWWLGLLAAVGTRYISGAGKKQRLEFNRLKHIADVNDRILLRTFAQAVVYG